LEKTMRKTMQHLDDEHMRLYEWSGTGGGITLPQKSKRGHPWHASYAVLAVLTSLLILNGCDNKRPAGSADEQVGQAAPATQDETNPKPDGAPPAPEAAQQAAPAEGSAPPQGGTVAGSAPAQ
jgi:hypothetical protein